MSPELTYAWNVVFPGDLLPLPSFCLITYVLKLLPRVITKGDLNLSVVLQL